MATANANYKIVPLNAGVNGPFGVSGITVVHQVYCMTNGGVTITALGGGSMTVSLAAGQSVSVLCSSIRVNSGTFVGFSPSNMGSLNVIKSY